MYIIGQRTGLVLGRDATSMDALCKAEVEAARREGVELGYVPSLVLHVPAAAASRSIRPSCARAVTLASDEGIAPPPATVAALGEPRMFSRAEPPVEAGPVEPGTRWRSCFRTIEVEAITLSAAGSIADCLVIEDVRLMYSTAAGSRVRIPVSAITAVYVLVDDRRAA